METYRCCDVPWEFADAEGEDFRSIENWREGHWSCYAQQEIDVNDNTPSCVYGFDSSTRGASPDSAHGTTQTGPASCLVGDMQRLHKAIRADQLRWFEVDFAATASKVDITHAGLNPTRSNSADVSAHRSRATSLSRSVARQAPTDHIPLDVRDRSFERPSNQTVNCIVTGRRLADEAEASA